MVIAGGILTAGASTPVYLDPKAPIEDRVEDALKRMTMEEKVASCTEQVLIAGRAASRHT